MPTKATVSVPALRSFEHEGRSYVRGEMVTVPPATALALARARKVSLDKQAAVVAVRAIEASKSNRRYARRDMQAEKNNSEMPRRGRHRRRDLEASE